MVPFMSKGNQLVCVTGALMYLNEATLLNNVRLRYMKNGIYVSASLSRCPGAQGPWLYTPEKL